MNAFVDLFLEMNNDQRQDVMIANARGHPISFITEKETIVIEPYTFLLEYTPKTVKGMVIATGKFTNKIMAGVGCNQGCDDKHATL